MSSWTDTMTTFANVNNTAAVKDLRCYTRKLNSPRALIRLTHFLPWTLEMSNVGSHRGLGCQYHEKGRLTLSDLPDAWLWRLCFPSAPKKTKIPMAVDIVIESCYCLVYSPVLHAYYMQWKRKNNFNFWFPTLSNSSAGTIFSLGGQTRRVGEWTRSGELTLTLTSY